MAETPNAVHPTDAVSLKRFFKRVYGIPVRVSTGTGKYPYIQVWIPSENRGNFHAPLTYAHLFPVELGNQCMRIVYAKSESLSQQAWGGNVTAHSIAMHRFEWEQLLEQLEPA